MKPAHLMTVFGLCLTGGAFYLIVHDHAFTGMISLIIGALVTCVGFAASE